MQYRIYAAALAAFVAPAAAAPITYFGYLTGAAEPLPNASPGAAFTLVTADATAHTMDVHVAFGGLLAPATSAHIHCCTTMPGGTAAVATTTPSFPSFPSATSGSYDHTFDTLSSASYNPSFVSNAGGTPAAAEATLLAGIAAGNAYLDIHTSNYPGGEIRAFLLPDAIFRDGLELP